MGKKQNQPFQRSFNASLKIDFQGSRVTDSTEIPVRFYNKRGTAEQWIKEGKQAVKMTRLSCHRFRSNEVRLWLSVLAYNLGNLWSGTAEEDQWLVLDQLAAAAGEDRWAVGEARPLLLAATGRESSDAAALWEYGAADRGVAGASGIETGRWLTKTG
jgi:hypothetical protein